MKINIVYKADRYLLDVLDTDPIGSVKEMVSKVFNFNSICRTNNIGHFQLYYNGSTLNDECTVSEVGLKSGSTIRCKHFETSPYTLKIEVKFLSNSIELRDEVDIQTTTIGELRTILQDRIGIPVSVFKVQQTDQKMELFDNRSLAYYDIQNGDTLALEVWKGTREVITAALSDDISQTLHNIPSYHDNPIINRYLLKVALFIAAHKDYVNLAAQVLQRGVRCDEPVSEYPARQWCLPQSHPDVFKTPVHQAALRGSFRILNIFLRHSPTCIVSKDGYGRSPSIYASKNGHSECWKLLMVAQFQFQSICGFSLVTYSKIMRWCNKARDRILYFKVENKKQLLLHSNLYPADTTYLGEPISISGYDDGSFERDTHKIQKLSLWSYNMNNNSERTNKMVSNAIKRKTNIPFQRRASSANLPSRNILPNVRSYYANTLKRELDSRSKASKSSSVTDSNKDDSSEQSFSSSKGRLNDSMELKRTNKQNAHLEARRIIFNTTGKYPTEIAKKCFAMGQSFDKMKWRSQMNIALKCSLGWIEKNKTTT